VSSVASVLPPDLAAMRRSIEEGRVLFDVGSAALDREADRIVAEASRGIGRLEAGVAPHGFAVRLELVGRTDPTGSDSTNQSLSRLRADAVAARLAALGFAGVARVAGVGTSRPVPAAGDAERARLNRSVSLVLRLEPLPRGR
jgi:outer membrane protein OmpA-like peptidoglycan-associated protein